MASLTYPSGSQVIRREYDPADPVQVAKMRATFDQVVGAGNLGTVTRDGVSETLPRGQWPEDEAEVVVTRPFSGG